MLREKVGKADNHVILKGITFAWLFAYAADPRLMFQPQDTLWPV
jgi:hypothetical protein